MTPVHEDTCIQRRKAGFWENSVRISVLVNPRQHWGALFFSRLIYISMHSALGLFSIFCQEWSPKMPVIEHFGALLVCARCMLQVGQPPAGNTGINFGIISIDNPPFEKADEEAVYTSGIASGPLSAKHGRSNVYKPPASVCTSTPTAMTTSSPAHTAPEQTSSHVQLRGAEMQPLVS